MHTQLYGWNFSEVVNFGVLLSIIMQGFPFPQMTKPYNPDQIKFKMQNSKEETAAKRLPFLLLITLLRGDFSFFLVNHCLFISHTINKSCSQNSIPQHSYTALLFIMIFLVKIFYYVYVTTKKNYISYTTSQFVSCFHFHLCISSSHIFLTKFNVTVIRAKMSLCVLCFFI